MDKLIKHKDTKLPCKECICLPICKNRRHVKCSLLFKWTGENQQCWGKVHRYIPKWMGVTDETYPGPTRGFIKDETSTM